MVWCGLEGSWRTAGATAAPQAQRTAAAATAAAADDHDAHTRPTTRLVSNRTAGERGRYRYRILIPMRYGILNMEYVWYNMT